MRGPRVLASDTLHTGELLSVGAEFNLNEVQTVQSVPGAETAGELRVNAGPAQFQLRSVLSYWYQIQHVPY